MALRRCGWVTAWWVIRALGRRGAVCAQFFVKPTLQRTRANDREVFYKGVQDVRRSLREVLRKERKHLGF
jgi:hypothetical protein